MSEEKEKSQNGEANGLSHDEKPKNGEIETNEAQEEKIRYPKSVFFIISNEFCERFSFYGMRTILSLYLKDILLYSESDSTIIYHVFTTMAYFFPLLGAIVSDSWLGKFRTILYVSMIYACGNILLALSSAKPIGIPQAPFSLVALLLIAIGTGGIKPCVSSFGGDQFVIPQQEQQLVAFFSVFYFAINAGSLISTFLTPVLREDVHCFGDENCYPLAFAIPGILMIVSIVIFFLGMPLYKIRKPEGNVVVQVVKCIWYAARKNRKSKEKRDHWMDHAEEKYGRTLVEDIKITLKVLVVFIPLPIFWSLYDQQGSRWTFQATRMDGRLGATTILPDQMQVINPILILLFIPLFTYGVYPFLAKFNFLTTPLRRMVWGGFFAAAAYAVSAGVAAVLEASDPVLPSDGLCQLRIYNPYNCNGTFAIDNVLPATNIGSFGYDNLEVDCYGTKNYTYSFNHCLLPSTNATGTVELTEATGYVFYPSMDGLIQLVDDINKPEDGLPKIRTLVGNPSKNYTITFWDEDEVGLQFTSGNSSLFSIDPGTYAVGNSEYELNLGGVYTAVAQLTDDSKAIKEIHFYEITQSNNVHILWQVPQYLIITGAEILFSITGLEFSYSQAPPSMKSVLTSAFLLTSAVGNIIIIIIESIKIFDRMSYDFLLYVGLMVADMIIFTFIASRYKYPEKKDTNESVDGDNVKPEKRLSHQSAKE
ncbi:hypothetical protein Zmor_007139 [Zophobas morio]|uniref:Oligopeptide transporter 1 n=1 Tax=Zophobas morio TaxID=2755281 RepID=A0AA38MPC5_9CUCU|nr:hypothetical protein Zmor_007139 [Zophobas morio]